MCYINNLGTRAKAAAADLESVYSATEISGNIRRETIVDKCDER